jgi:hypothetical protein
VEGALSGAELTEVDTHVRLCGACDIAVERLKTLEAASPRVRPARWFSVLRNPAWGYGLAAAVACAWLVSMPARQPAAIQAPAPLPQAVSAPSVNLDGVRGGEIDTRIGGGDVFFTFLAPIKPGKEYHARIETAAGKVLSRTPLSPSDKLGNCSLFCPRELLARGAAKLVVEESGADAEPRDVSVYVLPRE